MLKKIAVTLTIAITLAIIFSALAIYEVRHDSNSIAIADATGRGIGKLIVASFIAIIVGGYGWLKKSKSDSRVKMEIGALLFLGTVVFSSILLYTLLRLYRG